MSVWNHNSHTVSVGTHLRVWNLTGDPYIFPDKSFDLLMPNKTIEFPELSIDFSALWEIGKGCHCTVTIYNFNHELWDILQNFINNEENKYWIDIGTTDENTKQFAVLGEGWILPDSVSFNTNSPDISVSFILSGQPRIPGTIVIPKTNAYNAVKIVQPELPGMFIPKYLKDIDVDFHAVNIPDETNKLLPEGIQWYLQGGRMTFGKTYPSASLQQQQTTFLITNDMKMVPDYDGLLTSQPHIASNFLTEFSMILNEHVDLSSILELKYMSINMLIDPGFESNKYYNFAIKTIWPVTVRHTVNAQTGTFETFIQGRTKEQFQKYIENQRTKK